MNPCDLTTAVVTQACAIGNAASSLSPGIVQLAGTAVILCIVAVIVSFIYSAIKGHL